MSTVTVPYVHPGPDPLEDIPVLPEEQATRRDVLLGAAELLERDGWTASLRLNGSGERCLVGAICRAAALDEYDEEGYHYADSILGRKEAYRWNDKQDSSVPVISALRRIANGATWEEATAA